MEQDLNMIQQQARTAVCELLEAAKLSEGDIFVVGCSSSEVTGGRIGHAILLCARTRPKFIGGSRACYDGEVR